MSANLRAGLRWRWPIEEFAINCESRRFHFDTLPPPVSVILTFQHPNQGKHRMNEIERRRMIANERIKLGVSSLNNIAAVTIVGGMVFLLVGDWSRAWYAAAAVVLGVGCFVGAWWLLGRLRDERS